MLQHPKWSPGIDHQIRRRRLEGANWQTIAAELFIDPLLVAARGQLLGVADPRESDLAPEEDPAREPLPPGHPRAWNTITAGTVLQGEPYPLPWFRR